MFVWLGFFETCLMFYTDTTKEVGFQMRFVAEFYQILVGLGFKIISTQDLARVETIEELIDQVEKCNPGLVVPEVMLDGDLNGRFRATLSRVGKRAVLTVESNKDPQCGRLVVGAKTAGTPFLDFYFYPDGLRDEEGEDLPRSYHAYYLRLDMVERKLHYAEKGVTPDKGTLGPMMTLFSQMLQGVPEIQDILVHADSDVVRDLTFAAVRDIHEPGK